MAEWEKAPVVGGNKWESAPVVESEPVQEPQPEEPSLLKKGLNFALDPLLKIPVEMVMPMGVPAGLRYLQETQKDNIVGKTAGASLGASEGIADILSGITSPLGIATMGAGALPSAAQRVLTGAFGLDMLRQVPERAKELGGATVEGDSQEIAKKSVELLSSAGFGGSLTARSLSPKPFEPIFPFRKESTVLPKTTAVVETVQKATTPKPPPLPKEPPPIPETEVVARNLEPITPATTVETVAEPFVSTRKLGWLDVLDEAQSKVDDSPSGKIIGTLLDRFKKGDRSPENLQNMASLLDAQYDPLAPITQAQYKTEKVFGPSQKVIESTSEVLNKAESERQNLTGLIEVATRDLEKQTDPIIRGTIRRNISKLENDLRRVTAESDQAKLKVAEESVGKPLTPEELAVHAEKLKSSPILKPSPVEIKTAPEVKTVVEPVISETQRATVSPAAPEIPKVESPKIPEPVKQPEIVGMGGAKPEEFIPPEQFRTSNKNRIVDQEREAAGLPPLMEPIRRRWSTDWNDAMKKIDEDPSWQDRMIEELQKKPRPVNSTENVGLLHRRADIKNEYNKAQRDAAMARDDGRLQDYEEANLRVRHWSDKLAQLEDVVKKVGTESGRSLAARKQEMNEDFSLAALEMKKREVNGFRPLTEIERSELEQISSRIENLQTQIDKFTEEANAKKIKNPAQYPPIRERLFEVEQLEKKFKLKLLKDKIKNLDPLQRAIFYGKESAHLARSFLTSGEFSAVLRQGKIIVMTEPRLLKPAMADMFRAFRSERGAFESEQNIAQRPNYKDYQQSGLSLTDLGEKLGSREEIFLSLYAENIPIVAGSQRAYVAFLNRLRADTFDTYKKTLELERPMLPVEKEAIANYINVITGRGSLPQNFERAATALSTIFFAPRYVASRFQYLTGQPFIGGTARTRKLIAKQYAKFFVASYLTLKLADEFIPEAEVEWDPRSSDFGKIKIGDTRIDPMAGLNQITVFSSRIGTRETKTQKGAIKNLTGKLKPNDRDMKDVIVDFGRSKLAPIPALAIDLATGKDIIGREITPESAVIKNLVPISWQDLLDTMEEQGIPRGTALQILAIFGEGVSTYEERNKTIRDKFENIFNEEK